MNDVVGASVVWKRTIQLCLYLVPMFVGCWIYVYQNVRIDSAPSSFFERATLGSFTGTNLRIEIDFGSITGGLLFVGVTSMHFCRNQPTFVLMQNHIYYRVYLLLFIYGILLVIPVYILYSHTRILFPSKRAFRGSSNSPRPTLYTGRTWIQSRHPSPAAFGTQPHHRENVDVVPPKGCCNVC